MPLSDFDGCTVIMRQVYIQPALRNQTLYINGRNVLLPRSVIQHVRGNHLLQFHVYGNRMPLVGANQSMVFVEGIPLLLIFTNNPFQRFLIKRIGSVHTGNQIFYICPAMFIQCDSDGFRLMTQNQGYVFACIPVRHSYISLYRFIRASLCAMICFSFLLIPFATDSFICSTKASGSAYSYYSLFLKQY